MKKFSIFLFLGLCCIMYAQSQQLFTKDKSYSTENSSNFKTLSSVLNYDGENYDAVGMQNAGEYGAYAYFPSSAFSSFNGKYITAINVFLSNVNALASSELRLYSDMSSEPFYKESFTAKEGWNTIILDSLLKIGTSTKIYAGYYLVSSGGFHMGCDAGPRQADGYGDIMYWNGSWSTLFDITGNSISANWNIRLLVNDTNSTANPVCTPTAWELSNPVAIGNTKTSENFTLTNIGKDTLTISEITGLSAPFSTSLNVSSVKLGEGKSLNFNFTFTPTEENSYDNNIIIKTNGGDITINLKAESYTPSAIAGCTPTKWFISPGIGITAKSGKFIVTNAGETTLTCTGLSGISEPFSSNFKPANFSNIAPGQSKTFNFLYSPTESGFHSQTVILETNGGNVEIKLIGEAIECDTLKSSWSESFNGGSLPKDWITIDEDGDGYNWISFNKVMLPTGSNYTGDTYAHSGSDLISSWSYYPVNFSPTGPYGPYFNGIKLNTNNYLITPPMVIPENADQPSFTYYVRNFFADYYSDEYSVVVAENGGINVEDFTTILKPFTGVAFTNWEKNTLSLSDFKGKTIRIAIIHKCYDKYGLLIDDVSAHINNVGINDFSKEKIYIYPNPTNDYIKVYTNELSNITITDLRGSVVYAGQVNNNDIISTENFESGLYIVTIETKYNISKTKLIIN